MEQQFHSNYAEASRLISDSLIVNSLKVILRKLRMPSNGRKAILQAKLLDYLSSGYRRRDYNRIKYVYDLVMLENNPPSFQGSSAANSQATFHNIFSSSINSHQISTIPSHTSTVANATRTSVSAQRPESDQQPRSIIPTHTHQYTDLISKVVFRRTPFYELKKMMTEPQEIATHQKEARSKYTLRFTFTSEDVEAIQHQNYRVYLLSVLIDPTKRPTEYGLDFPQQMEILVNNHFINANVRGVKGKSGSATAPDVTKSLTVTMKIANLIEVTVKGNPSPYAMFAYLVHPVSNETILKRIKSHPLISKKSTVQRIIDDNNDDEIQTLSTVLSLKCPLSYTKMTLPVRSIHCDHIECFDALSFLLLQKQAATWTCPICNKMISFEDLAVDEYSLEIIQKTTAYDIDEMKIESNGSWNIPQNTKMLGDDEDTSSDSDSFVTRRFDKQPLDESIDIVFLSDSEDEMPLPETVSHLNGNNGQAHGVAVTSGTHTTTNIIGHNSNNTNHVNDTGFNNTSKVENINHISGQGSALEQNRIPIVVPQESLSPEQRNVPPTSQSSIPLALSTNLSTQDLAINREASRLHEQVQNNQLMSHNQGPTSSQSGDPGLHQNNELHSHSASNFVNEQASANAHSGYLVTNSYLFNNSPSTHQNQVNSAPIVPSSTNITNINSRPLSSELHQQVSTATAADQNQSVVANSVSNAALNSNTTGNLFVRPPSHQLSSETAATQVSTIQQTQMASSSRNRDVEQNIQSVTSSQNTRLPNSRTEVSISSNSSMQPQKSTSDSRAPSHISFSSLSGLRSPTFPDLDNFSSLPPWETSVFFKFSSSGANKQTQKDQVGPQSSVDTSINSAESVNINSQLLKEPVDSARANIDKADNDFNNKLQRLREKVINSSSYRRKETPPIDTASAAVFRIQNENSHQDSLTSISLRSSQSSNKSNSPIDLAIEKSNEIFASEGGVGTNVISNQEPDGLQSHSDKGTAIATPLVVSNNTISNPNKNATTDEITANSAVPTKNQSVQFVRPVVAAAKKTTTASGVKTTAPLAAKTPAVTVLPATEQISTLGSKRNIEVIDLTLSEDEEDQRPPTKR